MQARFLAPRPCNALIYFVPTWTGQEKIVNFMAWHYQKRFPTPNRFLVRFGPSGPGKLMVLGCPTGLYFRMALGIACSCSIHMIFSCAIFWYLYIMLVVMPNKNLTEFICMLKFRLSDLLNINYVKWVILSQMNSKCDGEILT